LEALVRSLGHRPFAAANAVEALRRVGISYPEVALVDLGLPGADGCELARQLRAQQSGRELRLVALTGYSDEGTRANAADAGFDDFAVKPVPVEALGGLIEPLR
jgi:CheY-like chemotaxis protein